LNEQRSEAHEDIRRRKRYQ